MDWHKRLTQTALNAIFAANCMLCGNDSDGESVCDICRADLQLLPKEHCPVCALPSPNSARCGACLKHPKHFDATLAPYRYAYPVDRLIQALKYSRRLASADFLARPLAALPQTQTPDFILPVPLSAQRLGERGFNQAVELARPLARKTGVPLLLTAIRRCRHTTPQTTLPWKVRATNIRHAFECDLDLTGKTVWVVDDVMTTGATLDEIARVLKLHGAVRVENRVVARALRHA
jgi:ComF family protein